MALILVHRVRQFVAQDVLDAHVDRQAHRLEIAAAREAGRMQIAEPVVVDVLLDAGDALIVDVDQAEDVRGGRAARIEAALLGQEADAGNAEASGSGAAARA